MRKRQREQLHIQHTRRLLENLLKDVRLSRTDDFIQFGNCIQLKALDMPSSPPSGKLSTRTRSNNGLVMAGTIHEKHIGTISSFVNDCRLIASPIHVPCTRNCFIIKSADGYDRTGENVVFGQEFVLQVVTLSTYSIILSDVDGLLIVR